MLTIIALGQEPEANVKEVKVTAPQFAGIENAVEILNARESATIIDYLAKNIQYPEKDAKCFNQGTEVIQFTVTTEGELTDFVIINSVSREIDQEMIRVLKTTNGMWIPGINENEPTEGTIHVSLAFCTENNSSKSVTEIFTEKATHYFKDGNNTFLVKHNPKKALKYYNHAINYLPNDKSLLLVRGVCRFETGDKEGAHQDWERLKTLGGFDVVDSYLTENLKGLKSYDELTSIFKE
jgi:tetratricopeptide (TPR) repeat protein